MDTFRSVAERFGIADAQVEPVGTGGDLAAATGADGAVLIRKWPADTAAAQPNLVATVLARVAEPIANLLPRPVPVAETIDTWSVTEDGGIYTAMTLLEGRPLARYGGFKTPDGVTIDVPLPTSAPADQVILDVARVLGTVHQVAQDLTGQALGGRVSTLRVLEDSRTVWNRQRPVIGQSAGQVQEIRRWLRCGNRVFPVAEEYLGAPREEAVTIIHGDLWPTNVLVTGASPNFELSGLTGWSTLRAGSPLVDLAALVTHTSGWSGARAESVLGAYTETAALSPVERRLLPVIAALDLVPRVGTMLQLAYLDDRMIGDEAEPVLRSALKSLLHSLENLTSILAPEARWDQRKANEVRRERSDDATRKTGPKRTTTARQSGATRSRQGSPRGTRKAG